MAEVRGGLNYTITADVADALSGISRVRAAIQDLNSSANTLRQNAAGNGLINIGPQIAQQNTALQQLNISQKSLSITQQQLNDNSLTLVQRITNIQRAAREATSSVDGIAGSVLNFLKVTVAFRAANAFVNALRDMVTGAVEFNRTIENTNTALASIFVTVGQVRDVQGSLLTGAAAFGEAIRIAGEQTSKLRQDALGAGLAFDSVAKTFQNALAPGLQAGFNVDQIRAFSVEVTQAARVIGLSEGQIATSLRGILAGGSQGKRNALEIALGLSPQQIDAAKKQGELFDLLQNKLQGLVAAGGGLAKTFDGLFANATSAIQLLVGAGSLSFFESLKGLLGDIIAAVTTKTEGSIFSPNPAAVSIVQALTDGLKGAVDEARLFVQTLDLTKVLPIAVAIGTTFKGIAAVVGPLVSGFVSGLSDLAQAASAIGTIISPISALLGGEQTLRKIVTTLAEAATVIVGIKVTLAAIGATVALLASPIGVIVLSLLAAAVFTKQWLDSATGLDLKFGSIRDILATDIIKTMLQWGASWDFITAKARIYLENIKSITGVTEDQVKAIAKAELDIEKANNQLNQLFINAELAKREIIASNASADTFGQALSKGLDQGKTALLELIGKLPGLQELLGTRISETVKNGLLAGLSDASVEKAETSFVDKLNVSLVESLSRIADGVRAITTTVGTIINDFANTISTAIADAFDPTKKVDIKERFATLLGQIGKLIISEIIKIAIASALLKGLSSIFGGAAGALGGAAGAAGDVGSAAGGFGEAGAFASGGSVGSRRGRASAAHMGARGFARGGRPGGLPASDTVPAWLTPGEWVMRLDAVKTYGSDVMASINQGLVNPLGLRALAGSGPAPSTASMSKGPGYAMGGVVADQFGNNDKQGGTTVLPVVVANDQTMSQLLAGGAGAFFRFVEQNPGRFRTAMGLHGAQQ